MAAEHSHNHAPTEFNRAFAIGIALNIAFVAIEAFYGWKINSLALLADAGHKLGNIAKETKTTKYPELLAAANLYLTTPTSKNLKAFILLLKDNPETAAYRRDLLYRFISVLKLHIDGPGATYLEAANLYALAYAAADGVRHESDYLTDLTGYPLKLVADCLDYGDAMPSGFEIVSRTEISPPGPVFKFVKNDVSHKARQPAEEQVVVRVMGVKYSFVREVVSPAASTNSAIERKP